MGFQGKLLALAHNLQTPPVLEGAKEQQVGQGFLDFFLDQAGQRAGSHQLVVAFFGQPLHRFGANLQRHLALFELGLELPQELAHNLLHDFRGKRVEVHDGVQAVAKLRGEEALEGLLAGLGLGAAQKPTRRSLASAAPALVVMIRMVLRKSTVLPLWSVSLP